MIPAKRLKLTPIRRATEGAIDPDSGQVTVTDSVVEQHLFMEPGGYCKHTDGVWNMQPPDKTAPNFRLVSGDRTVIEHDDDGTITVVGKPFRSKRTAWRLERGQWIEVKDPPPAKPEPEPAAVLKPVEPINE